MEIRTGEIFPEVLTATFSQYGPTMFGKFVLLIHIFTFSASFSLSPPGFSLRGPQFKISDRLLANESKITDTIF